MTSCEQFNRILKGEIFNFIAVDNFTRDVVSKASVFFLTHYHSDHFKGLDKEYSAREIGNIFSKNPEKMFYCSDITRRIFESNRGKACFIPESQIKSQPIGQPFNIFGPAKDNNEPLVVTVTFVPSGHILGAVMILFEHENERALFTGDFRIYPKDIPRVKALHDCNGDVKEISHLYIDTTFAGDQYTYFPLRSEVSKSVAQVVSDWLSLYSRNEVHINLPYTFAYENLIVDLSKNLECKIMVNSDVYEKYYRYIPELDNAVFPGSKFSDRSKYRIHASTSKRSHRIGILETCEFCLHDKSYVQVIRPSAMIFKNYKRDNEVRFEGSLSGVIRVPYSAHCSLEELQSFVKYLSPKEITTICDHNNSFIKNVLSLIKRSETSGSDSGSFESASSVFAINDFYYNSDSYDCGLDSPTR